MKTVLTCLMILFPILTYGQSLVLAPTGMVDVEDPTKDFVVLPFEGKSAEDLYKKARGFVQENFISPKDVIVAESEGEYLRYKVYVPQLTSLSRMLLTHTIEAIYEVELRFRDGRIRYNILGPDMNFKESDNVMKISGSRMNEWSIYDTKGKLLLKKEKAKIDDHFNSQLKRIIDFVGSESSSVSDDW